MFKTVLSSYINPEHELYLLAKSIQEQFQGFKKYCCSIKALLDQCDSDLFSIDKDSFNTSYPKIMDNIIMAFVKETMKPKRSKGQ